MTFENFPIEDDPETGLVKLPANHIFTVSRTAENDGWSVRIMRLTSLSGWLRKSGRREVAKVFISELTEAARDRRRDSMHRTGYYYGSSNPLANELRELTPELIKEACITAIQRVQHQEEYRRIREAEEAELVAARSRGAALLGDYPPKSV